MTHIQFANSLHFLIQKGLDNGLPIPVVQAELQQAAFEMTQLYMQKKQEQARAIVPATSIPKV